MTEYLIQWKFGANSLLNHTEDDTSWYTELFDDKDAALTKYTSLKGTVEQIPEYKMTVEVYEVTKTLLGSTAVVGTAFL